MALPSSGQISLSQVNTELGFSSTATISLNDSAVRTLFGIASGTISLNDGHGKANQFAFTIASNQTNANLASLATAAGWNGSSKVVATVASGIYISSNSTGTPALTISGSFPGGVELINNGYIVGRGGNGGNTGVYSPNEQPGAAGGLALSVSSSVTITNNNTIGGGGGGGGGGGRGAQYYGKGYYPISGGGGGGGRSSAAANSSGGSITSTSAYCDNAAAGGTGTVSAAGSGGTGGAAPCFGIPKVGGNGGSGGGWGSAGSAGANGSGDYAPGRRNGAAGGAGGAAVSGNANISWVAFGTRLGAIT